MQAFHVSHPPACRVPDAQERLDRLTRLERNLEDGDYRGQAAAEREAPSAPLNGAYGSAARQAILARKSGASVPHPVTGKRPRDDSLKPPPPQEEEEEEEEEMDGGSLPPVAPPPAAPPPPPQHRPTDARELQRTAGEFNEDVKEALKASERALTSAPDAVRFGEPGWKDRYYQAKFEIGMDADAQRVKVCVEYVKGLCWVLKYYCQGVPSWTWYYPYHYAPCASDLISLPNLEPARVFQLGEPFPPLEQLMAVLPPLSAAALPPALQPLMIDDGSPSEIRRRACRSNPTPLPPLAVAVGGPARSPQARASDPSDVPRLAAVADFYPKTIDFDLCARHRRRRTRERSGLSTLDALPPRRPAAPPPHSHAPMFTRVRWRARVRASGAAVCDCTVAHSHSHSRPPDAPAPRPPSGPATARERCTRQSCSSPSSTPPDSVSRSRP